MEMSGMNNEVLMSSKSKKKSSSLPTESRLETVDHLSTFRECDKEKKIKKNTQQRNVSDYRYSCLPLKSFEGNHFSQHESSLSSDTSCSSLEFHRPEEWQKKLSQQRQSANLSEEQQRLYSFVFGLSDFNNPVQPNKFSGTYIPLKENRHMYLNIQDKNDKRESTISSVSSKSSTDSWTRKERREALKARVEAQREQLGESSSEEEMTQKHSRCYSDIGLHRDNRLKSARSERYHKRRSQDEANVKCFGSPDKVVDLHENHVSENIRKPPVAPYLGLCYNWQKSNIYKDLTVKEEEQNCQKTKDNAYETKTSDFEMNKLLDKTRSVSSLAHFTSNSNATKERSQLPDNPSSYISPDISFCSASGIKYSRATPRTQQREISHRKFSLPINLLTRVTSTITTGRESLADALITSVSGSTYINSHTSASYLSLDSEICLKDDQSLQQAYTTSSVVCGSSLKKEPTLALDVPSSTLCDPHFGKTFKPLPNNSCPVTCCPPAVKITKPIQVISHPIMSYTFVGQINTPPNISHQLNQASTDGRAPTPPPRSPQSKIVYNETVHQLCSSQPNLINHSLLTHTESQKATDKYTVNCNSSINQRKFVLNEKCSNSRSKIQQFPKSEGKIENTCVTDTSSKIKMHEKEISQHTKNSHTFTANKNNMIYSYTDMPPKQTLASLINCSKSYAPVYSYTDQAPLSKTFLNKDFPEKTDILHVHDSQRNVKNSTNFVEMMSGLRTRQRNRMTVSNNKFNVRVPKINDYLAKPEEVKINEQEQSQVNCNCEMTETDFCNTMINSFNRDTCCTLKTSGNCALSESKCSFTDSVENNASLFFPAKVHSGSTLSLETAKKQIDEFVQRERKKKFSENFVNAVNELQEIYNNLRFTDEELTFQEQNNSHPPSIKAKCGKPTVSQECKDSSVFNCVQNISNKMQPIAGYPLTRSSSDGKNFGLKSEVKSKTESLLNATSSDTSYRRRFSVSNSVENDPSFNISTPGQDKLFTTTQKMPKGKKSQLSELISTTKAEKPLNEESQSSHMDQMKEDKFHEHPPVYRTTYFRPLSNIPRSSFIKHFNTESEKREKDTFLEKTNLRLLNEIDCKNSSKDRLNNNKETTDNLFVDCEKKKKHRAVRSLSANIANIAFSKELNNNSRDFERAQSIIGMNADRENCLFSGKHEASSNSNTTKSLMEMSTKAQQIKDVRVSKHMSVNFAHENASDKQIVSREYRCIRSAEEEDNVVDKNVQLRKNDTNHTNSVASDFINLKVTRETQDPTGRTKRPMSLKLNSPKVASACHRICQSTPSLIKQVHPLKLSPTSKYFQPQVIHELKHSITPLDERQLDDLLSTLVSNSNSGVTE